MTDKMKGLTAVQSRIERLDRIKTIIITGLNSGKYIDKEQLSAHIQVEMGLTKYKVAEYLKLLETYLNLKIIDGIYKRDDNIHAGKT